MPQFFLACVFALWESVGHTSWKLRCHTFQALNILFHFSKTEIQRYWCLYKHKTRKEVSLLHVSQTMNPVPKLSRTNCNMPALTIDIDTERDERVENFKDDWWLNHPVVVKLAKVVHDAHSSLIVLWVINLGKYRDTKANGKLANYNWTPL